jgi:AcrR family transcriptional regulator
MESESHRPRAHSGRRRNEEARRAILDATFRLLEESGAQGVTLEATAAAAGVGRQTIYRWWSGKGQLIAEALAERAKTVISAPDTGSFRDDLAAFFVASFADATDPATEKLLREFMALAQTDEHVAAIASDFAALRREPLRKLLIRGRSAGELRETADLEALADLAYGFLWYRLLLGHAPLDDDAARQLADMVVAAGS